VFWWSTPEELGRYLDGFTRARRDMVDALTVTAWQVVAFDRTKRLPDLQRMLSRRAEREEAREEAEPQAPLATKEQLVAKWRAFFERARTAS
jgi:hypothetical protein